MYFAYFLAMPSLKKLKLYYEPDNYVERDDVASDLVFPKVVDLTIVGIKEEQPQSLLDTLAITFPNLLKLRLVGLGGFWGGKLPLALSKYSLDRLIIFRDNGWNPSE